MTQTLDDVLRQKRQTLAAAGVENPALDARILVRRGAGLSEEEIITNGQTPLSNQQIELIEKMVLRRAAGEPVSRILGGREFWGLWFKVTEDTLDPRPDTETLVSAALKRARAMGERPLRILDLGTGTGCILIALLSELPNATGVGVDINAGAISVSCENATWLGVAARADFRMGSWFSTIKEGEQFDLIVSNPPYIPEPDIESLAREVRNHDPIAALTPGKTGLEAYKIILKDLKKYLVCGGYALMEIGMGQDESLIRLVEDSNIRPVDSYHDLGGIVRVVEMSCGEK